MKKPLLLTYFFNDLLLLFRTPSYLIMTMLVPLLFFLFFGVAMNRNSDDIFFMAASFSVFAIFGIVFFQFGVSVASDRDFPWYNFLRTLPIHPYVILCSRTLSALTLSFAAISIIFIAAFLIGKTFPPNLFQIYGAALLGAIPTALMGLSLGYWLTPRNVLPAANLLYLVLSFAGGLWTPPQQMPDILQQIALYLPTYNWGSLVWSAVEGKPWSIESVIILTIYTLFFGFMALLGYKRDEGTRFS